MRDNIARLLRELREERDWKLDYVAYKLHVHKTTVQKWEKGIRTPSIDTFPAIAELYGIPLQEFISRITE